MLSTQDEDRLLLIPGPTPVARQILDALARPTISHTSADLAQEFMRLLKGLRTVTDNESGKMFVISGSGTLAQEAALLNFVEGTDRLLVVSNGFFGDRLGEIARAHGLAFEHIKADWGACITPSEMRQKIQEYGSTVVAFAHVETSTGVMAPLEEYMGVIKETAALSIVDGVAGLGGVPEEMSRLGIDVLLAGSQKALGVPPGLAIIAVSPEAWERRLRRPSSIRTYFMDLIRWAPVMDKPDTYFSTHPVNLLYALGRSLELLLAEGLDARYARHRDLAEMFRTGLFDLGFQPFTDAAFLAPTLSVIKTPPGVSASDLRTSLHQAGVVAAGGIKDMADRVVRFGHMGNISRAEIAVALDAVQVSLQKRSPDIKPI